MANTWEWQPLIHGRTYKVDYRSNLIAVPNWFTSEDLAWALPFIQGTFDNFLVKGVPDPVHWSVFQNERCCVVGLTCMAHQVSSDCNRDIGNRVLPVFLGYITRIDPVRTQPVLPPLKFGEKGSSQHRGGQFCELYRFVRERWDEKRQANPMNRVAAERGTLELPIAEDIWPTGADVTKVLNDRPERIKLYPVVSERTDEVFWTPEMLWGAASHFPGPFSLCLGLSRQSQAVDGPFLNATAYDVSSPSYSPKPLKSRPDDPAEGSGQERTETLTRRSSGVRSQTPTGRVSSKSREDRAQYGPHPELQRRGGLLHTLGKLLGGAPDEQPGPRIERARYDEGTADTPRQALPNTWREQVPPAADPPAKRPSAPSPRLLPPEKSVEKKVDWFGASSEQSQNQIKPGPSGERSDEAPDP